MSWLKHEQDHKWREMPPYLGLGKRWSFVNLNTGRLDGAEVTKREREGYKVWCGGAGYGEFESLEDAKRQAEKHCK
jgi:hypothetical protein